MFFTFLRRDEAARACCVCAAWRRAFSSTATAHLWADIVFNEAHFGGLAITSDVVQGAASKAGASLRSLTLLPNVCASLVPVLAAAHAGLRTVRLASAFQCDRPDEARALLHPAALPELELEISNDDREFCHDVQLQLALRHPSLRVLNISTVMPDMYGGDPPQPPELLRALTAALRTHATTLRALNIRYDDFEVAHPSPKVTEFAEALGCCTALESLFLGGLLAAKAFEVVAVAAARGCHALRAV